MDAKIVFILKRNGSLLKLDYGTITIKPDWVRNLKFMLISNFTGLFKTLKITL